jgi:hypothetical protein
MERFDGLLGAGTENVLYRNAAEILPSRGHEGIRSVPLRPLRLGHEDSGTDQVHHGADQDVLALHAAPHAAAGLRREALRVDGFQMELGS